jgi:hypothetical protein|tara:strand:+ start:1033 stop:1230 length:198 start_codon:yes stop_codon:yes gene_type:complete
MFKINEKEYDESKLSTKGKSIYLKLIRLSDQKADLDVLTNYWTAQLSAALPKEEKKEDKTKKVVL